MGHRQRAQTDVTINTQAAFDSVNGMFKGALPQDFMWSSGDATQTGAHAGADGDNLGRAPPSTQSTPCSGQPSRTKPRGRTGHSRSSSKAEVRRIQSRVLTLVQRKTRRRPLRSMRTQTCCPAPAEQQAAKALRQKEDQTEGFAVYEDTEFLP